MAKGHKWDCSESCICVPNLWFNHPFGSEENEEKGNTFWILRKSNLSQEVVLLYVFVESSCFSGPKQ